MDLSEVHIAPNVFQWRDLASNEAAEQAHLRELIRVLNEGDSPLDPLLVTAVGERFWAIDGHHRLEAYHSVDWKRSIPVEYFEGSLKEAQEESLRRNSKNKLPMTNQDKLEAAWKLVRQGSRTQRAIAEVTTASLRTVASMAKVLREHPEIESEPWRRARQLQWGQLAPVPDDWLEQKARKLAQQWVRNLPTDFTKRADVMARAIALLSEELPRQLISQWPDLAQEVVSEMEADRTEFDV